MFTNLKWTITSFNWRFIFNLIGNVILVMTALLTFPLIVSLLYRESCFTAFITTILISLAIGYPLSKIKLKKHTYFAKEGVLAVGLSWIVVSLLGALPFYLSHEIPSYIDCFFETVSGFTTTGSSILTNVEALSNSLLFWRSFTHWIGGMGVLVFVLAIIPKSNERTMHVMRAEAPGPVIGKLVPRLQDTAKILYTIYIVLTLLEVILLLLAGMNLFDALCHSFGTAGTGGFGIKNNSIAYYDSSAIHIIITVFMILFGVNFNLYYFLLIKEYRAAFKDQEMRTYFGIIFAAIAIITINILPSSENLFIAMRDSAFQVGSIITTTGYSTVDFNLWPTLSKIVLFLLMFMGASAGSTGGGMKVSRFIILFKKIRLDIQKIIHPNKVDAITMNGKIIPEETVNAVLSFFACYMFIAAACIFLVALDNFDFETTFSGVIACLSNIGPGFGICGPVGNFQAFSSLSKIVLSFAMLIGRLEIYPIIILFIPLYLQGNKRKRKTID